MSSITMTFRIILSFLLLSSVDGLLAQTPEEIAQDFLSKDWKSKSLKSDDVRFFKMTDSVPSSNGLHHVYFQQTLNGIPVDAAIYNVSVFDSEVIYSGSSFIANLANRAPTGLATLDASDALQKALQDLGETLPDNVVEELTETYAVKFDAPELSSEKISADLMYTEIEGEVKLVWGITIWSLEADSSPYLYIDAFSGNLIAEFNRTISDNWLPDGQELHSHVAPKVIESQRPAQSFLKKEPVYPQANSYRVYPWPVESPNYTSTAPPGDGRELVFSPADLNASPLGWHNDGTTSYTTTQGNNVDAQKGGVEADCGPNLDCDFPLDLTLDPTGASNVDAAIANLFYWNNIIHDIMWNYGFDELAGNFQETNAGGGLGSDGVTANAQAPGNCNANFATPPDGVNPTMNMFICNIANPSQDGDFDNGVIVHEYGHGLSNRLVGGPSNTSCLRNGEQAGEGFSDIWGLWFSMEPGDTGADPRGIGTWLLGQAPDGLGVRTKRYSTDMTENDHTYSRVSSMVAPHGVGEVFATAFWDVNWELIRQIPFDADLANGSGGNNVFMELFIDALQMVPCSGDQLQFRDAFMAALDVWNMANGNAINACSVWENAWARRGYGANASSGGGGQGGETDGFELPSECLLALIPTISVDKTTAVSGETLTYTLEIQNNTSTTQLGVGTINEIPDNTSYKTGSVSCNQSGAGSYDATNNQIVISAASLLDNNTLICNYQVIVDGGLGTTVLFADDQESGTGNWSVSTAGGGNLWESSTINPNSGATHWFVEDITTQSDQYLDLNATFAIPSGGYLKFQHAYDTEANWDGGVLEVERSTLPLLAFEAVPGSAFSQGGYNSVINPNPASAIENREAFSGDSGGYLESIVDLSAYTGESVKFRWRFASDAFVGGNGWFLDDVEIAAQDCVFNSFDANSDGEPDPQPSGSVSTCINDVNLPVEMTLFDGHFDDGFIKLQWRTASELNNAGFYVEMQGLDRSWRSLGFVEGFGNSTTEQKYSFEAENLEPGWHLFRLKQVDLDGGNSYSNAIEVRVPMVDVFHLSSAYPNPFNPKTRFSLVLGQKEQVTITLYDTSGRRVLDIFDGILEANNPAKFGINAQDLPSGTYFYNIVGESFVSNSKSITLLK